MRKTPSIFVLFFLLCLGTHICSYSQYRGGSGDGIAVTPLSNAALGVNIFKGGLGDGIASINATAQPLGINYFTGGVDDGITSKMATNQTLGANFFKGGQDDGIASITGSTQALGINFYKGGAGDGFDLKTGLSLSLGINFYRGGANDGFAFGMGTNLPLPITLKRFDAFWKGEDVVSQWTTSMEINTDFFEVERSVNGADFVKVTSLKAAGNSTTEKTYTFTDTSVNRQYSTTPMYFYYRLKTVDKDGIKSYSSIVALPNKLSKLSKFVLYPNPAKNYVTLKFREAFTPGERIIKVIASDGKILFQQNFNSPKKMINTSMLSSGMYYIQVLEKGVLSQQIKLLIQ